MVEIDPEVRLKKNFVQYTMREETHYRNLVKLSPTNIQIRGWVLEMSRTNTPTKVNPQ